MSLQMSTGLCNSLLDQGSAKSLFDGGFVLIFGGAAPAKADDAINVANLLCTISNNKTATGLTWGPATGGVLPKTAAEVWAGSNRATGVATHFRVVSQADDGLSQSGVYPRVQGSIGIGNTDMVMGNPSLTINADLNLNYGSLSFVPS
jgi:hypothetical protein